jgi:hypothetical protein
LNELSLPPALRNSQSPIRTPRVERRDIRLHRNQEQIKVSTKAGELQWRRSPDFPFARDQLLHDEVQEPEERNSVLRSSLRSIRPGCTALLRAVQGEGFVLVTGNVSDFRPMFAREEVHPGLVVMPGEYGRDGRQRLAGRVIDFIVATARPEAPLSVIICACSASPHVGP